MAAYSIYYNDGQKNYEPYRDSSGAHKAMIQWLHQNAHFNQQYKAISNAHPNPLISMRHGRPVIEITTKQGVIIGEIQLDEALDKWCRDYLQLAPCGQCPGEYHEVEAEANSQESVSEEESASEASQTPRPSPKRDLGQEAMSVQETDSSWVVDGISTPRSDLLHSPREPEGMTASEAEEWGRQFEERFAARRKLDGRILRLIDQYRETIAALEEENRQLFVANQALPLAQENIDELQGRVRKLEALTDANEVLQTEAARAQGLNRQVQDLTEQLERYQDIEGELNRIRDEKHQAQEKLNAQHRSEVAGLEGQLHAVNQRLEEESKTHSQEQSQLQEELESAGRELGEMQSLRDQLAEAKKARSAAEGTLQTTQRQLKTANRENAKLQRQINQLQSRRSKESEFQEINSELRQTAAEKSREISTLKSRVRELKTQLEDAQKKQSELQANRRYDVKDTNLENRIRELNVALKASRRREEDAVSKARESARQLLETKQAHLEMTETIKTLREEIENVRAEISKLKSKTHAMPFPRTEENALEIKALRKEITKKHAIIQDLEQKNRSLVQMNAELVLQDIHNTEKTLSQPFDAILDQAQALLDQSTTESNSE